MIQAKRNHQEDHPLEDQMKEMNNSQKQAVGGIEPIISTKLDPSLKTVHAKV